jgi:hypothetical protein
VIGFQEVSRFVVPAQVISDTIDFLREIGTYGCEGLALWVGTIDGDEAVIKRYLIPKQAPVRSGDGLSVHVDGETLYELNVWLHQNRMRLFAQVHSHGEHAYHSDTDNEHSVVTTLGALSIVVPHFAVGPFNFKSSAVLRLTETGWLELTDEQAKELIKVR